jgi:hypothetical protein
MNTSMESATGHGRNRVVMIDLNADTTILLDTTVPPMTGSIAAIFRRQPLHARRGTVR